MKITDLKKELGDFYLEIDNLELENGLIHGIIGPNGSGKTTLAKVISGVIEKDSGNIDFEGLTPMDITMTSQKPYLLHDSVYNNLIYPLKIRNVKPNEKDIDYWLERCSMLDKKNQYARSLSSGEQQKLSFIRSFIFNPRMIIVDETLSNLDPDSVKLFENIILETQTTNPITLIIISHQLVHIKNVCDKVHFMFNGKNIQSGSIENVLINPTNEYVTLFLSNTEISFKGE